MPLHILLTEDLRIRVDRMDLATSIGFEYSNIPPVVKQSQEWEERSLLAKHLEHLENIFSAYGWDVLIDGIDGHLLMCALTSKTENDFEGLFAALAPVIQDGSLLMLYEVEQASLRKYCWMHEECHIASGAIIWHDDGVAE